MSETTTEPPLIEVLRSLELFAPLSDERLTQLAAAATEFHLRPGEFLVHEGDPPERFNVIAEGQVEWIRVLNGEEVVMGRTQAPTYTGTLTLLTEEPSLASGRAVGPVRSFCFGADTFHELIRDEPSVLKEVARQFRPVYQGAESALRQRDKLAALGSLSAGLAHELNNPAAAARSTAADLGKALQVLQDSLRGFVSSGIEREEAAKLVELQREALERAAVAEPLDTLDAADRADALADELDARGVEGWKLAPTFVESGLDVDWLERVAVLAGPGLQPVLDWVAASLTAHGLVEGLHESIGRISGLVKAVKEYTYMDRASQQEIDVHDGLETTLTILGHKLRRGSVQVVRDYDRTLPRLMAFGSELNQVWTNLIDNAIDALDGNGTIRISTRRDGDAIVIEVADDGPGVPPELQDRLFEPFFTTKDVGQGTGLGLDVARRIVQTGHRGTLTLHSQPGDTRFTTRLPIGGAGPTARPDAVPETATP